MSGSSSSGSLTSPPFFNGENYKSWKSRMKNYLKAYDLWRAVEKGPNIRKIQNPSIADIRYDEDEQAKAFRSLSVIQSSLSDNIERKITDCTTAKEAWELLEKEYKDSENVKQIKLIKLEGEYEQMRMADSETLKNYVDKLSDLVAQMKDLGEEIPEKKVIRKLLVTLPERFEAKISTLEEKDLSKETLENIVNSLQTAEQRFLVRQKNESNTGEEAFRVTQNTFKAQSKEFVDHQGKTNSNGLRAPPGSWGKFSPCGTCNRTNHKEEDCFWKGRPACFYCKKFGHVERTCRVKEAHMEQDKQKQEANVGIEEDDEYLFMAQTDGDSIKAEYWIIDSGCTSHMSNNFSTFSNFNKLFNKFVTIGDGTEIRVEGIGSINIAFPNEHKTLNRVLYVPEIKQNLLSVGQLVEDGYKVVFSGKTCSILDDKSRLVAETKLENRCYKITTGFNNVVYHVKEADTDLWHKRFGHFNHAGIKHMFVHSLTRDLPPVDTKEGICESCEMGKIHKKPFANFGAWRAKEKLELVHTDICGPMRTPSWGECRYFLLFIDDYTRFTWVYFLKNKSETSDKFRSWKAAVELESGRKLRVLRSDRGGEYTSKDFERFCEEEGVKHQLTAPYTPQQNGVSERKNRITMEMARSMLAEKKLPKEFWAEAVHTAIYLLNRLPTKAVKGMIPYEAWHGIKPSVLHLRTFGSICFMHIPAENRSKLDFKARKGIFVGYSERSKAYRFFDVERRKLVITRDLKFDENSMWNWSSDCQNNICELNTIAEPNHEPIISAVDEQKVQEENDGIYDQQPAPEQNEREDESVEDQGNDLGDQSSEDELNIPVRGYKSLADIYERCNVAVEEPGHYFAAAKSEAWKQAMEEEIKMIEKNKTWTLIKKPLGKKVIGVKWVYRIKLNPDGTVNKYKARLVAKGYAQQQGKDYTETFAPVARLDTVRLLVALAAQHDWNLFHLDVKSAFLNGHLNEEVYVSQPEGFEVKGDEHKVYKLQKALYGLKQAPRAWYSRIDGYLLSQGFCRSKNEAALYVMQKLDDLLIVSLYVDDMLITGNNISLINQFKEEMKHEFEMSDLGELKYFLGLEVEKTKNGFFISQEKYANDILKKFGMENCKPVNTPVAIDQKVSKFDGDVKTDEKRFRSLVGSLLYLCSSRPDLMFATSLISRFMHEPTNVHLDLAKRILRYIKGTTDFGIYYAKDSTFKLIGYTDSDWGGCADDSKSTSGFCFGFGTGVFSWNSKKQAVVAQSTAEAEYIAAASAVNQAIWLKKILIDLGVKIETPVDIYCDSNSAIAIANNPIDHGRTKHIKVKYHFLRDAVAEKEVALHHCCSEDQVADILTKALPKGKFMFFREKMNVVPKTIKEEC